MLNPLWRLKVWTHCFFFCFFDYRSMSQWTTSEQQLDLEKEYLPSPNAPVLQLPLAACKNSQSTSCLYRLKSCSCPVVDTVQAFWRFFTLIQPNPYECLKSLVSSQTKLWAASRQNNTGTVTGWFLRSHYFLIHHCVTSARCVVFEFPWGFSKCKQLCIHAHTLLWRSGNVVLIRSKHCFDFLKFKIYSVRDKETSVTSDVEKINILS